MTMECEPLKEMRWVRRMIEKDPHVNPLFQTGVIMIEVTVLQQKWVDGWGQNTYWEDVPTVNEEN